MNKLRIRIKHKFSRFMRKTCSNHNSLSIKSQYLADFMLLMQQDKDFLFDILLDHTAVDWIEDNTFDLIYNLYSSIYNEQILITTTISRKFPIISTMSHIWRIAEWQERECYDFFGILYKNHQDLRRIFLEDDWLGFPLRKDYRDNFILEKT